MHAQDNPHTRFGFEHAFLFDGTWHVKGDPDPCIKLIVAYVNTLGFALQYQGISPRRLRVAPFPDFSYRIMPTRDIIFLLLGESRSRTVRYALYEDRLEGHGPGREVLLKECEEVLGWDHCLCVQFPFSALTDMDQLNQAAEHAAQETATHLIGVMNDTQAHEHTTETSQIAQTLLELIADDDLRQRCEDLLSAEKHYDRVIREACVILEHRVRQAIGADNALVGTALMEQAFNPKSGVLRLSTYEPVQRGVMQLYQGVMAFFRNPAGHQIANDMYTQHDALRFVLWIDVLLKMVATASTKEVQVLPPAPVDVSVSPETGNASSALATDTIIHAKTSLDAQPPSPPTQAAPILPAKKPIAKKMKTLAPSAKLPPASKPKVQVTPKKAAQAVNALATSPTPGQAIQEGDRQQMISFLVQIYKEALKSYPNGWVPITVFGSKLMITYPSFKKQFHPKMRLPTFLKQQQDIFQTQTKGKHLEVRLLESYQ